MNNVKVQLLEKGKIIQEEKTHNFLSKQAKLNAEFFYKCHLLNGVNSNMYTQNVGLQYAQLQLWDNIMQFEDSLYALNSVNSSNSLAPANLMGYCNQFSQTISGGNTQQGIFLPTATTYNGSTYTYCWEWATTQGNGTIKSLGFVPSSSCYFAEAGHNIGFNYSIPALNFGNSAYIGYVTQGSDKILYFRQYGTYTNNIVGVKESDFSLVETLSLNVNGGEQNNTWYNYNNGYCIKDTVLCNGYFYTLNSDNYGVLNFKKAPKGTLTYGSAFNVNFTRPSGYTNWTYPAVGCMTSDERYIYITYYYNKTGSGVCPVLLVLDTTTDTITSVIDTSSVFGITSSFIPICKDPFNADYLYWGGTLRYSLSTNKGIVVGSPGWNCDLVYFKNNLNNHMVCRPWSSGVNNTMYVCYSRNPSLMTYAELANPITKTNSQSLRVQYTFQIF